MQSYPEQSHANSLKTLEYHLAPHFNLLENEFIIGKLDAFEIITLIFTSLHKFLSVGADAADVYSGLCTELLALFIGEP